ncbi:MAG: hypothetical protein PHY43_03965 [Verrucomicrobiales bacterium]|nr:hypothetical protein [Verrucomicrobiales bacterium]
MKTTPRWYCSYCKRDVKILAIVNDADSVQRCPDCGNNSAVFLQYSPRPRRVTTPEPFLKRQTT